MFDSINLKFLRSYYFNNIEFIYFLIVGLKWLDFDQFLLQELIFMLENFDKGSNIISYAIRWMHVTFLSMSSIWKSSYISKRKADSKGFKTTSYSDG